MDAALGVTVPFALVVALSSRSWLTWPPTAIVAGVARLKGVPMSAAPDLERLARDYAAAGDWPAVAQIRDQQAKAALSEGDLGRAASQLREALSLFVMVDDGYSAGRALADLAEVRLAQGDYLAAAELSGQAADRIPGDVQSLVTLGYAEWQAGSPADAEVTFSRALHWDADAPGALAGRGQVRAELGDFADALDDLDRVLADELSADALPPAVRADAQSARALALAGLGRTAEARDELARALEFDPDRKRTLAQADRIAALAARPSASR
jgi:tetratricopeptide (TPR) repeat protein